MARDDLPGTPGNGNGWLYAIVALEVRRVKIGVAEDVWKRARALQTASPCELLLHSATYHDEVVLAEARAHAELAHARVRGEWFDLTDTDVDAWLARRETATPANLLFDRVIG